MRHEIADDRPIFEKYIFIDQGPYRIKGAIDIVAGDRLYEVKTVHEVSTEHFLQLAVYAFMMKLSGEEATLGIKHYLLYNVRNDELYELTMSIDELEQVVRLLICNKEHPKPCVDDDTFLHSLGVSGINIAHSCARCRELGW